MRARFLLRLVSTAFTASLALLAVRLALPAGGIAGETTDSGGDTGLPPDESEPAWSRPAWYPPSQDLAAVAEMEAHGPRRGPTVRSRSAFVYDLDRGEVLFERAADDVRPVASLTKLVSSLAMVSLEPDLDATICIGPEHRPTRSGARSRLSTGDCISGWDALGAALVASDNRGAYALATAAGVGIDELVDRMNEVSADLGMDLSWWSDPSGLEDDNLSTARDMARAAVAVAEHPLLSMVASAPWWDVHYDRRPTRRLGTTNRLAGQPGLLVEAAKTGYTDTARYCFATVVETPHRRRLVVSLLGAEGKATRFADVLRIVRWADTEA